MRPSTLAPFLLTVVVLVTACTGETSSAVGSTPIPEVCTSFVAAYRACLARTLPSLPDVADQRASQTRAALQREASEGAETAALTAKCEANLSRLSTTCNAR